MTDILERAKAALESITYGSLSEGGLYFLEQWEADARFTSAAPELVRDLIAEVERLREGWQPIEQDMSDDLVKQARDAAQTMSDITHADEVYVGTSKNGDYVQATPEVGFVKFVRADLIEDLEAKNRELAMQVLAAEGQAADAYQAQLAAEAKLEKAVEAGMHIATTAPLDGLQDAFDAALAELAFDAALAELKGGEARHALSEDGGKRAIAALKGDPQ